MTDDGTRPLRTVHPEEVTFVARLASLGRKRDRWCVSIPPEVARLLHKQRMLQITVRVLGSIQP